MPTSLAKLPNVNIKPIIPNVKFHEKESSGSGVVSCLDRRGQINLKGERIQCALRRFAMMHRKEFGKYLYFSQWSSLLCVRILTFVLNFLEYLLQFNPVHVEEGNKLFTHVKFSLLSNKAQTSPNNPSTVTISSVPFNIVTGGSCKGKKSSDQTLYMI
jgi:hypothetical protein